MSTDAGPTTEVRARAAVTVRDLQISTTSGVPIVINLSFDIAPGEVLGVVGESGSGKTTVGLSLLGHARRGLEIVGGSVLLGDQDILELNDDALRRLRGSQVSYVPQDPASSLNPALRIGLQLREVLEAQRREIVRLRNNGDISNDVMHRLERELDLEDSRLES